MIATIKTTSSLDPNFFLAQAGKGRSTCEYSRGQIVFSPGDPADSVFYIRKGQVKISFHSKQGKKATIAILAEGDIFGEECLIGKRQRMASVATMIDCTFQRVETAAMIRALQGEPKLCRSFISYMLARKLQAEQDLVDQMLRPIEKRLARRLVLMTEGGASKSNVMRITQETLAEMIGTTQSRVSFFMNKFRRLGFIEYNGTLKIRGSSLKAVLDD